MAENFHEVSEVDFKMSEETEVSGSTGYLVTKKLFDYSASALALILLSPVFAIIGLVIKLQDGGQVFFKQIRIGQNGEEFTLYKFRSMVENAEEKRKKLLEQNEIDGAMFKIKDDPRITGFGKFIRRHSLDELPQLINVLKGDMSLIGPRPPLPSEVANYTEHDKERLLVQPGLSGLWQVSGRNALSFDNMVELDLTYIRTRSVGLDLKIIFKTIWGMVSVSKNGAY